ncbi:hydroxyacid dehydrogenase [Brucella sp. BE17]|uniref:hydroxyacid dehydrogenase n=1 Tax=Brucella sp. BE17 TaxID=3142977 RepID=UPI0031BA0DCF
MSTRFRIVATSPLHPDAEDVLRQSYDYEAVSDGSIGTLRRMIVDADGIIVRNKLPDDIFNAAGRILACVRHGVGLDFIPVEAATAKCVAVANLLEANKQSVVEHVVATTLILARNYGDIDQRFRTEGWSSRNGYEGIELAGKTIGIVGCGRIGRGVARAMRYGFGMQTIGYNRSPMPADEDILSVSLADLFARADIVSLHMPSTARTRGIVDESLLGLMKPGSLLINAGRGDLVDETALIDALSKGRPAAAAIDVFEPEPIRPDHPFLKIPNIFLTPHIAGGTREASRRMSMQSVESIDQLLSGERPNSLVNPDVWEQYLARLAQRSLLN